MSEKSKTYMILMSLFLSVMTFFTFGIRSCRDADTEVKLLSRDSLLQKEIDSIKSLLPDLEKIQYLQDHQDTIYQHTILKTEIKYKEREKEFNNLSADSSYNFVKSELQKRIRAK